jgi:hypothetical protein
LFRSRHTKGDCEKYRVGAAAEPVTGRAGAPLPLVMFIFLDEIWTHEYEEEEGENSTYSCIAEFLQK